MKKFQLILFILLFGCIEEIDFDFRTQDTYLVIDGFITNNPGPHTITVSETIPFANDVRSIIPGITNAVVSVADNEGNVEPLTHTENGAYVTSAGFSGVVGRSYTLQVMIGEEIYESTPQLLYEPVTIDSTTYDLGIFETFNNERILLERDIVNFYSSLSIPTDSTFVGLTWDGTFRWIPSFQSNNTQCWIDENSAGLTKLLDPAIFGQSVCEEFIDFRLVGNRFSTRYSFNQVAYSYGKETHQYFEQILSQVNSVGSVFDPLPFTLDGNMANIENEEEVVLGYFAALGQTSDRVFINRSALRIQFNDPCIVIPGPGGLPSICFDCTNFRGAYTNRPDFWED